MYIDRGDNIHLMRALSVARAVKREPITVEAMPAEPDPPAPTRREKLIKMCREYLAANGIETPPLRTDFPSLALINKTVRQHYGLSEAEFTSGRRADCLVKPRQIAMYLATTMARASLHMIGRYLNRHHTTVVHGIRMVGRELQTKEELRDVVDYLKARIMQRFEEQKGER